MQLASDRRRAGRQVLEPKARLTERVHKIVTLLTNQKRGKKVGRFDHEISQRHS